MLEAVRPLPPDPILGVISAHARDPAPHKMDLGVGVYRDVTGATPVFAAVTEAQARLAAAETTKAYVAPPGDPAFLRGVTRLLFGADHPVLAEGRVAAVQTPGGCGALRLAAELLERLGAGTPIWVPTPTWANHEPLLGDAGCLLQRYPYYDHDAHAVDFDAMHAALAERGPGDVVLLHACCHNPCGGDLTRAQWDAVADLALERGFTPFVDIAYHGLAEGLTDDAYGVRLFAERLPEVLVAYSCSKNFGLYRERAGVVCAVTPTGEAATAATSQLNAIARGIYSMPPAHGAAVVGVILDDADLTATWEAELASMRRRLQGVRALFADRMADRGADFGFIAREHGMFSFLGISPAQVERLRTEHSVYMVGSSRINVAGITEDNVDRLADALVAVLDERPVGAR